MRIFSVISRFISRVIDGLNHLVGRLVAFLCLGMILVGAYNSIVRYLGRFVGENLASNAFLEAQWYMFSMVFLLGAAWALADDRHVRVDVLYGRLGPKGKATIDLAGTLLFLLPFCVFAIVTSWPAVSNSWSVREVSPDPGGLPRYPIKAVIPVAFGLLFLQGISQAIKHSLTLLGADAALEGSDGG